MSTPTHTAGKWHHNGTQVYSETTGKTVAVHERGLHLVNDWAVSYHKSTYRGRPCYYIRHSAIEHIWT